MNQWIKLSISMVIGTMLGFCLIWLVEGSKDDLSTINNQAQSEILSEATNF